MRFNRQQRALTAEILGNVAVAWVGAGIIVPFFTQPVVPEEFFISFISGTITFFAFYSLAIYILRN